MQVTARLYLREKIGKLGLAPLTSMYTFGENQPGRDDYRPEVHDSDGLSIQLGDGEWLWRPLVNPRRLLVTSFGTTNPRGFGLMQRDRSPANYEDPGGAVRAPAERLDRAGRQLGRRPGRAGADPDPRRDQRQHRRLLGAAGAAGTPGKPLDIAYRIRWQAAGTVPAGKGWVVQTRRGRGFAKRRPDGDINYVVDFDGPALRSLAPSADVEPVIWVDANAEVRERNLFKNPSAAPGA